MRDSREALSELSKKVDMVSEWMERIPAMIKKSTEELQAKAQQPVARNRKPQKKIVTPQYEGKNPKKKLGLKKI